MPAKLLQDAESVILRDEEERAEEIVGAVRDLYDIWWGSRLLGSDKGQTEVTNHGLDAL